MNKLEAKALQSVFREKYKNYKVDPFGFSNVFNRNKAIRELYLTNKQVRYGSKYGIEANILTTKEYAQLKRLLIKVRDKVSDNRKTITVCKSCKEAVSGRKIRKDVKNWVYSNYPCELCGKYDTKMEGFIRLSKTQLHKKVPK